MKVSKLGRQRLTLLVDTNLGHISTSYPSFYPKQTPSDFRAVSPCISGGSIRAKSEAFQSINDTTVDTIILAIDDDGSVVEELMGVNVEF